MSSLDALADLLPSGDPFTDFDPKPFKKMGLKPRNLQPQQLAAEPPPPPPPPVPPEPAALAAPVAQPAIVVEPPPPPPPAELPAEEVNCEQFIPTDAVEPAVEAADHEAEAVPAFAVAEPKLVSKSGKRRRRSWSGAVLGLMIVGLFGGLAGCLYLLISGKVLTTNGEIVAAGDSVNNQRNERVADDRPVEARGARDNVMGRMADRADNAVQRSPKSGLDPTLQPGAGNEPMDLGQPDEPMAEPPMAEEPVPAEPMAEEPAPVEPMAEEPMADEPMADEPTENASDMANEETAPEPTPPMQITEADIANELAEIEQALRTGDYAAAQLLAEGVAAQPLEPALRDLISGYRSLADLADYYREGIGLGADTLGPAKTFELTPGITVAVVEVSRESISLKIEGRVKRFALAQAPLVIVHRIAEMGLPLDDPVAQAAKGAYQAMWGPATDSHRQQAFDWWSAIESSDEALSPKLLEPAIRRLYNMPPTP